MCILRYIYVYEQSRLQLYLRAGFFLCSANLRLDKFSGDIARVLVGIDDEKDFHHGLSVVEANSRFH